MNTKHTQGPLHAVTVKTESVGTVTEICREDGSQVGLVIGNEPLALLFTAAPELLDALVAMVDVCESGDFDGAPSNAHMQAARAAIAKATGERHA